jgi:uncharacterized protein (TIGR03067 family)
MSKSRLLAALLPFLLLAADKPNKDAPRSDKLIGSWAVVAGESNGKNAPEEALKDARLIFAGHKLTASSENGQSDALAYKIDSTNKTKTIDITNPAKKQTILGIYALDGDQLKLCLGAPGSTRPDGFATKPGNGTMLLILKREK